MATTRKTFQKDGRWIEKTTKSVVLLCRCGDKYLLTRAGQSECLSCIGKGGAHSTRR